MAGLTPQETAEAVGLVRSFRGDGITMVIVEHVMEVVMPISDRVVVLDYGKKIAEGAPEEIVRNELVIKAYLGRSAVLGIDRIAVDYDGVPAIHDITVRVPLGTIVAVVGSNGSGKTTMLKTAAGPPPPVEGDDHLRGCGHLPYAGPRDAQDGDRPRAGGAEFLREDVGPAQPRHGSVHPHRPRGDRTEPRTGVPVLPPPLGSAFRSRPGPCRAERCRCWRSAGR